MSLAKEMDESRLFNWTLFTNLYELAYESLSGNGYYNTGSNVDVSIGLKEGYKFNGWYYNNNLLSPNTTYHFVMWDCDITLVAKIEYLTYTLTVSSNKSSYGKVAIDSSNTLATYNKSISYSQKVTIIAQAVYSNARFIGWFEGDNQVSKNAVYAFYTICQIKVLLMLLNGRQLLPKINMYLES